MPSIFFAIFSYEFKGIDINGQEFKGESDTVDECGNLSICGYIWSPTDDKMSLKKIALHNGVVHRGKITKVNNIKQGRKQHLKLRFWILKKK